MKTSLLISFMMSLAMISYAQSDSSLNDLSAALPQTTKMQETQPVVRSAALVNRKAEFPGGTVALKQYLATGFEYPQKAVENGVEGTVKVRFTIDRSGKAKDPEVVQSVHRIVDREVVRLIRNMPEWTPGLEDGKPVETTIEIPVEFALR